MTRREGEGVREGESACEEKEGGRAKQRESEYKLQRKRGTERTSVCVDACMCVCASDVISAHATQRARESSTGERASVRECVCDLWETQKAHARSHARSLSIYLHLSLSPSHMQTCDKVGAERYTKFLRSEPIELRAKFHAKRLGTCVAFASLNLCVVVTYVCICIYIYI